MLRTPGVLGAVGDALAHLWRGLRQSAQSYSLTDKVSRRVGLTRAFQPALYRQQNHPWPIAADEGGLREG